MSSKNHLIRVAFTVSICATIYILGGCRYNSIKPLSPYYALAVSTFTMGDTGATVGLIGTPIGGKSILLCKALYSGRGAWLTLHDKEIVFIAHSVKGSGPRTVVLYSADSTHTTDLSMKVFDRGFNGQAGWQPRSEEVVFSGLEENADGVTVLFEGPGIVGRPGEPKANISWADLRSWAMKSQ